MLTEHRCEAGAVSINYVQGPVAGPPLVLLHGVTDRWQDFLPIIPALSLRWHIYAPDFRGHGKSGWAQGHYDFRDYGMDIHRLIDSVVGEPVILVGHSLGGLIALWVAAHYPDSVRALVVGDSPFRVDETLRERLRGWFVMEHTLMMGGYSQETLATKLGEIPVAVAGMEIPMRLGDLPLNDAASLLYTAKKLLTTDPEVLEALLRAIDDDIDPGDVLRRITCPSLLLQADPALGGLLSDEAVQLARSLMPQAWVVRMRGVGHGLHLEQEGSVLRVLGHFLEAL